MKRTAGYLRVLLKRAAVLLPYILLICILMLAGVSAFAYAAKENRENDESKEKIRIGIVADSKHRYMKMALNAVENFDYSRMSIEFLICGEEQAKEDLDQGRSGGYLVIPEDFFDKIGVGEHHPMTYVTGDKESAFGIALAEEVIRAISSVLRTCEVSVNGIMEYIDSNGFEANEVDAANELIGGYFASAVQREYMFEIVEVGVSNGQKYEAYFFCAVVVFFMMLWGVGCVPLYAGRKKALLKILSSSGVGTVRQTFAEWGVHVLLMFVGIALILPSALLSLKILVSGGVLESDLFERMLPAGGGLAPFFFRIAFLVVPFSTVSYLFYEFGEKVVGPLMLQALYAILTGYICGCFYPSYFFSPVLQDIGACLPAGAAMKFLAQPDGLRFALLLGYTAVGLLAAALLRKTRLEGDRR